MYSKTLILLNTFTLRFICIFFNKQGDCTFVLFKTSQNIPIRPPKPAPTWQKENTSSKRRIADAFMHLLSSPSSTLLPHHLHLPSRFLFSLIKIALFSPNLQGSISLMEKTKAFLKKKKTRRKDPIFRRFMHSFLMSIFLLAVISFHQWPLFRPIHMQEPFSPLNSIRKAFGIRVTTFGEISWNEKVFLNTFF